MADITTVPTMEAGNLNTSLNPFDDNNMNVTNSSTNNPFDNDDDDNNGNGNGNGDEFKMNMARNEITPVKMEQSLSQFALTSSTSRPNTAAANNLSITDGSTVGIAHGHGSIGTNNGNGNGNGNLNTTLMNTTNVSMGIGGASIANNTINSNNNANAIRAKRLREEAIRRLVTDIQRTPKQTDPVSVANAASNAAASANNANGHGQVPHHEISQATLNQQQDLLVASTLATAIERGLDRDLHYELCREVQSSASTISKICHEHSESFLNSVGKVVSLGPPCESIQYGVEYAHSSFQINTVIPMLHAAQEFEDAKLACAKARTIRDVVYACKRVSILLERARKQASLARPRGALDAVDEARSCLTASLSSLVGLESSATAGAGASAGTSGDKDATEKRKSDFMNHHHVHHSKEMKRILHELLREENAELHQKNGNVDNKDDDGTNSETQKDPKDSSLSSNKAKTKSKDEQESKNEDNGDDNRKNDPKTITSNNNNNDGDDDAGAASDGHGGPHHSKNELRLEGTPYGIRATALLPKIENEVIIGARRGLNKWFLSIRSGGDGAKAGRAALRKCAASMAVGPGHLGMGGKLQGFTWRAKMADNLISRVNQSGRVARASRMGYWFPRDNTKDIDRLTRLSTMGVERRAEAFASAFGWYRCWNEHAPLEVEEVRVAGDDAMGRSAHGGGGRTLNRSGHGLNRSGHGGKGAITSRSAHGSLGGVGNSRHGRSLNFRASHRRDNSLTLRTAGRKGRDGVKEHSPWSVALTPAVLFDDAPTKAEDDEKLSILPESVHPVRRAEAAFALLGKTDEFRQYYELNRFGDMKIGDKSMNEDGVGKETRSSLSSLTGDDVSQGTDRIFFQRSLPHFCTSVVGFSAIEAALELGNIQDDEEEYSKVHESGANDDGDDDGDGGDHHHKQQSSSSSSFMASSARYERKLIAEVGTLIRNRAIGATLVELSRASCILTAFRSALKIVHPSSTTRTYDKELLAMDVDILMTGLKVAQEEQLRATSRILSEDSKEPMRTTRSDFRFVNKQQEENSTIPLEEIVDFPFGLADMRQKASYEDSTAAVDQSERRQSVFHGGVMDADTYKFSQAIPLIVRSIHARAIAFAAFAMSQEELGQIFASNKGVGVAGYVLDCVEQCVTIAAIGIKDGYEHFDELSVPDAVQITANIASLQNCLPRLFGTLTRGLCHVGMVPEEQLNETFAYADETLARSDKACDQQAAGMFTSLYELCRNKIDTLLHFSLDNFQWVARSERDTPNTYCESLIEYLRTIFKCLRSLEEGSKAGLHFSCCGHISERLVMLIAGKPQSDDTGSTLHGGSETNGLVPITKIDAYGLKNLSIDVVEFENFADGTGIPQLRECFNELRCITDALLDVELPNLLKPENESLRLRKYPFLNLDRVCNVLEKYQGTGIGGKLMGSSSSNDFLMLNKKDISHLIKLARSQKKH